MHLCGVTPDGAITVDDFDGPQRVIRPKQAKFKFPIIQRFSDGRWLVVESRTPQGHQKNASILSPDLTQHLTTFAVGDAVENVLIDQTDQIWVGYFDENPDGLKRFSQTGEVEYDFNRSSGHNIFDLYAMTMGSKGELWICPYTGFYLARLADDAAKIVLKEAPVAGAKAIAVGGQHAAFFWPYRGNTVTLCDLRTQSSTSIILTVNGDAVGPRNLIATHKDTIALLWDGQLFWMHMHRLIAARYHGS